MTEKNLLSSLSHPENFPFWETGRVGFFSIFFFKKKSPFPKWDAGGIMRGFYLLFIIID